MIFIICLKHTYTSYEDYINSIFEKYTKILYINNIEILFENKHKYFFIHHIPYNIIINIDINYDNIYMINTEQLCRTYNNLCFQINNYPKNVKIIDYCEENIKYYKNRKYFYLPYQINHKEIYNFKKNKDVCIIGDSIIPKNRQYIINILKNKKINIDIISGFGLERDLQLFKYKILLNIGYTKCAKIFEQIRCNRCIFNKVIVISDLKIDSNNFMLKDHMIFESYNNIPDRVSDILKNYDEIYNKLFNNLCINTIENKLKEYAKKIEIF